MNAFYLEAQDWNTSFLQLNTVESHHLSKVLRLKIGEKVCVLDGKGRIATCTISEIKKNESILEILDIQKHEIPTARVTLAAGWGKAARRGFALEKCVELEAHALWFWQAERSQFPLTAEIKNSWQEQLIAGAKQCHNPFLPNLAAMPNGAKEIIEASKHFEHKQLLVEKEYAHEEFMDSNNLGNKGDTICVIGPEGGFTKKEVELFINNGFKTLSMGDRILRWETAALMALGLHWWKKQQSQ